MCHTKLVLSVVAILFLFQASTAYQGESEEAEEQEIASSSNENSQQHPAPEPYSFSYSAESNGGLSTHQESGDGSGRVTGFYTIMGEDGRERRVDYVADADGYRAQISTNEVGTRAQSSADATYQVQLPSAGQLEAAKISYEQYKYLEDTHAIERQRVAAQSNHKHSQSQQSLTDFNRQQPQQFNAGQASTLQRGSSSQFQEGQQGAILPVSNNFVAATSQGSNTGSISTSYGNSDDKNDLGWRNAQLPVNRNRTVPKLEGASDFTSESLASTSARGTGFNTNQQFVPVNQQYFSAGSSGRSVKAGAVNLNQGGPSNYQSFQAEQQPNIGSTIFSGNANYQRQQQQEVSQQINRGRVPGNRNELQKQLEQQFLLQASGDQDYPRQMNGKISQTTLTPSSGSTASFQATNAQAIGSQSQQRDEMLIVSDERPIIPKVVPQTINTISGQQQAEQVSSLNQQGARGSSYLTKDNERDYQQVVANQRQGDRSDQFNYSNQFAGFNQEQTNILNNPNQTEEKNEAVQLQQLQQEQQDRQVGRVDQQQAQVSGQQAAGEAVTSAGPAPAGLISINLNESSENQRQEEQEVATDRPAEKQVSGLNFQFGSQLKNEQPLQQQQVVQTQVTREPVETQPIFRQTFGQSGTTFESRPNSINQIIENITGRPIIQSSNETRYEQRQGFKGAPRLPGVQVRTTTTSTTTERPEPISEVLVTTSAPLFSGQQEDQETTTTARVTYYQPTTAPTTTSTTTTSTTTTPRPTTSASATTTTTTTTTTPASTAEITRQTFVPTQRATEIGPSYSVTPSRRPAQQPQVVVQSGVEGGNKAPPPLEFKRVNKTSEFQYVQLPVTAPIRVEEPEKVSYLATITTRVPSRASSLSQVQRTEQAPYLSSQNFQSNANLDLSERPFVKYPNITKGEARSKIQQVQQPRPLQQGNYSQAQVSTNSQLSNEANYVTIKPNEPDQTIEVKPQPLKGTKGGYLSANNNRRQFWQQKQQQKLVPAVNVANQELARAMRSLTASVSYVDQEAKEHRQQPVSIATTRKATLTSAEDYASLRGFGSRVLAASGQSY